VWRGYFACIRMRYPYTYMHVHRDTIVRVALIPQLRWIQLLTLLHVLCLCVFQIRQEKPYYIADPEVDSLVSIYFFTRRPTRGRTKHKEREREREREMFTGCLWSVVRSSASDFTPRVRVSPRQMARTARNPA